MKDGHVYICTEVLTLEPKVARYNIDTQDKDTDVKNKIDLIKEAAQSIAFGVCEDDTFTETTK